MVAMASIPRLLRDNRDKKVARRYQRGSVNDPCKASGTDNSCAFILSTSHRHGERTPCARYHCVAGSSTATFSGVDMMSCFALRDHRLAATAAVQISPIHVDTAAPVQTADRPYLDQRGAPYKSLRPLWNPPKFAPAPRARGIRVHRAVCDMLRVLLSRDAKGNQALAVSRLSNDCAATFSSGG